MTKEVADRRYADRFVTYLFGYGEEGMVIDGFGTAMFMNHCCAPNCETEDDDGHIYVLALRDIAAGEELVYEYNLYDSDDEEGTCHCGAPGCKGTMFSALELERRAKKAGRRRSAHASALEGRLAQKRVEQRLAVGGRRRGTSGSGLSGVTTG